MRSCGRLVALALILLLIAAVAPPAHAGALDFDVPGGHFFTQANGQGGAGGLGYAVLDDNPTQGDHPTDGQTVQFWSEFQHLGGVATLGYPVSHRFLWDGFVVQAFQKAVLQWRPEAKQAAFVNVFDRLSAAGKDGWLDTVRQTPPSFDNAADAGLAWDAVVARHLALLDALPAIQAAYRADADPIAHFGLPMGWKDYGAVVVVRCQRAVFQLWKVGEPWARSGQVVVANGGDVAKEAGLYPDLAILPQIAPGTPAVASAAPQVRTLLVGPGTPGRLYALQTSSVGGSEAARLLTSDDLGATWHPFSGGLPPVAASCLRNVNLDYTTPDAIYASTCRGLYRWDGGRWILVSPLQTMSVAIAYGKATALLAVAPDPSPAPTGSIHAVRSDDGGQTWQDAGWQVEEGSIDLALDPRDPRRAYLLSGYKGYAYTLYRGFARPGQWTALPSLFPASPQPLVHGMALDGASGALYVAARGRDRFPTPWAGLIADTPQLWRTPNPDALNPQDVRWELVHDFGDNVDARLLASGTGPQGLMLFANLGLALESTDFAPVLYRSLDGGQTWQPVAVPAP